MASMLAAVFGGPSGFGDPTSPLCPVLFAVGAALLARGLALVFRARK